MPPHRLRRRSRNKVGLNKTRPNSGTRPFEVLRQVAGVGAIAALGVVTQRSTVIAWNAKTREPLAPAIGWQDTRTAGRTAELKALGLPASTQASATKIEWLLAHDPGVAEAARTGDLRIGTPDAWLLYKLGEATTDPSNASTTLLYDITTGDWHQELLALFGVDPAWLPVLAPTSGVVGETELFGGSIPLAARAGDQQAACFGHGLTRPGEAKLTLGNRGHPRCASGPRRHRPERVLPAWPLAARRRRPAILH